MAVVALLDRGLQGAPAGEGFWRGLGGLWRSLGHGHGPARFLLPRSRSLSLSLPSSSCGALLRRAEVVPVVKDHGDGLGRLGRDVAGVAQDIARCRGPKDARHSLQ